MAEHWTGILTVFARHRLPMISSGRSVSRLPNDDFANAQLLAGAQAR